ncbi:MAG: anaerobic ribonucleoside-triphosphate reductase activating protein [Nitrospirota bacterium]
MRAMGDGVRIKGFVEASFLDWPGKVSAVVFLPGCNFRCPFCHNGDLILNPGIFEDFPLEQVVMSLEENQGFVDGVTLTGGEPSIIPGLPVLLGAIKASCLPVKLDTNGSKPEVLKALIGEGLVDAVAMDIKAELTPEAYAKASGKQADIEAIRESIELLLAADIDVAFRTTVVPGLHDARSIGSIAEAVSGRSYTLQNFRPKYALDPAYTELKPFSPEEFRRLQDAAKTRPEKAFAYQKQEDT